METVDGQEITFGDMIIIGNGQDAYLTVDTQDDTKVSFQPYDETGKTQKLLVCGKPSDPDVFYLTFKYARGFLHIDPTSKQLKNGAPWTEKSFFNMEQLKQALALNTMTLHLKNE